LSVTEKVEAIYGQPLQLPTDDEGSEMRAPRRDEALEGDLLNTPSGFTTDRKYFAYHEPVTHCV